jgi:preprotein translocase subunit SecG
MTILLGLFSVILFLDCIVLIFLVLLQLPKKEAGAGMAFGGSATDALFGAGSGNALTTITKYSAGIFFGVALLMSILTSAIAHRAAGGSVLEEMLAKPGPSSGPIAPSVPPSVLTNPGVPAMPAAAVPALAPLSNSAAPPAASPLAPPVTPPAAPPAVAAPAPAPVPSTNR